MVLKTIFVIMDSLVGRVAKSRKSIAFHYAQVRIPSMISFPFRKFYCILFSYVPFNHVWTVFNSYTKCTLNGTLANTKTHMRDATEDTNSIGYELFDIQQPKRLSIDYELYSNSIYFDIDYTSRYAKRWRGFAEHNFGRYFVF